MGDWILNLPIPWMTLVIFAAAYFVAACVYLVVVRLAVSDRGRRAFKAFSPGMLPVLDHLRSARCLRRRPGLE